MFGNINTLRQSIGICMVFNAYPVVFFIRDFLGIGPKSSVFTAAFWALGLLIMIPMGFVRPIYRFNTGLFAFLWSFGLIVLTYLMLQYLYWGYVPEIERDILTFVLPAIFIIFLIYTPNTVTEKILPVIILYCLIGSISLVIGLIKDPFWVIGKRAAISFGNEDAQAGGNPHVYAYNALYCIIAAMIYSARVGVVLRVLCYLIAVFSLVILFMCQVRSTLFGFILIVAAFLFFNFRKAGVKAIIQGIFNLKNIATVVILGFILSQIANQFYDIFAIVTRYTSSFTDNALNIVYSLVGTKVQGATVQLDASSMGRVVSFARFTDLFASGDILGILFGLGHEATWLDVPILEAWMNYGILGAFFFGGFFVLVWYYAFKEIRNPTNDYSLFLAYFSMTYFVMIVTNGRPTDWNYWLSFMPYLRFLGAKYYYKQTAAEPTMAVQA